MDTPPADEMRLCSSCGSWIRRDRATCPWCHAEQSPPDDEPLAIAEEPPTEITRAVGPRRVPRQRHPWRRAFTIALLAGLMLLIGATAVGAYQGWQDRRYATQREAIVFFERGQELLVEQQYELAIANLREALRLEPNFIAAAQLIQIAEQRALAPPGTVVAGEAPPPTPLPLADNDRLFAEAAQALAAGDWEIAAATFDMLSTQSPDFRSEEVLEGLFRARRGAADAALEVGDLDAALRHIDQALAIRPEDQTLVAKRRVLSAYRTAQRAIRSQSWTVAADQLRTVYLVDPDFMDVEEQLARAHLELAEAFAARDIWCQAAQQYRASNTVLPDRDVQAQAAAAERRCSVRATAAPLRPTITPAPDDEATPVPTWTPTATQIVTATATLDVPSATPTIGIVAPTWTPQPTAPPQQGFLYYNSWLGERINDGCGGHYILGATRAPDGAPIPDVTILAIDEFGNRYTAVSKVDPIGSYNIPIPAQIVSYRVMVMRGDQQASPVVTVTHSERFATAGEACHIIDWTQR